MVLAVSIDSAIEASGASVACPRNVERTASRLVASIGHLIEAQADLRPDQSRFARRRAEDRLGDSLHFLLQLAKSAQIDIGDLCAQGDPISRTLMSFHTAHAGVGTGDSATTERSVEKVPLAVQAPVLPCTVDLTAAPAVSSKSSSRTESPQLIASNPVTRSESPVKSEPTSARAFLAASDGIKGCLRKTPRSTNSGSPRPEPSPTPPATVQFTEPEPTAPAAVVSMAAAQSSQRPKVYQSPAALRSRDGSFNALAHGFPTAVSHAIRAAGAVHSRSNSDRIMAPASPTGQPLFTVLDDHIFITSDDDVFGTLNAITVTSIHSASASPGGSKLIPPRARRGPSPRPPSTAALSYRPAAAEFSPPSALKSCGADIHGEPAAPRLTKPPSREDLDARLLAGPPAFGSDAASDTAGRDPQDEDENNSSFSSGPVMVDSVGRTVDRRLD